jgi:small-conductance mechanosensitive channel
MTVTEILDKTFLGNSLSSWLVAAGIALATLLLLWLLRLLVKKRFAALAESTETVVDDLLITVLESTRPVFLVVVSLWAGSRALQLNQITQRIVYILVVVVVLFQIGLWATAALMKWLAIVRQRKAGEGEALTWLSGIEWVGKVLIWSIVLLMTLENLGVDITGLAAGLGIGGIAVALAAQSILGDLFAAFSIYIDQPFVIGDYLVVGSYNGTVEKIGMKTTRLRSLTGEQLIFSNSDLVGSRIQNFGRLQERRVAFTVGVTYDTPTTKVEKLPDIIRDVVETQDHARFDRSHFKEFGDSALILETVYYVLLPAYQYKMDIQQAINLELKQRFEAEGIEFAFPTQTLYLEGADSDPSQAQTEPNRSEP